MSKFQVDFDIKNYTDILPTKKEREEYLKHDFIINEYAAEKGNLDEQVWRKHKPTAAEIGDPLYREREARRILKTGAWISIKDELIWLPPQLYFALQYCPAGASEMQFRIKRLKHAYAKLRARADTGCKGLLTLKSRGDGETTMEVTDAFWECLDGNMFTGQIGIQSRTRSDAINPCWAYVTNLWQNLPRWVKDVFCSDFSSGTNIAEKMQWMREANEDKGIKARNVLYTFYPSGTPMDGKHDMKICLLDEVCKWEECRFYDTFTNYSKFIMPGFERRGLLMMFSSPADKPCKSNEDVYNLWVDSNTEEIVPETGTTKSRVHRYYSNPLEGIAGAYDKWGDADPQKIYDHIMRERKKLPKDKLLAEIRGFPLNEAEMFEMSEGGKFWDNHAGIEARKIYLIGTRFKNEKTKEPKCVYGNLEWPNGVQDGGVPEFRMSGKEELNDTDSKFCFSYLPKFTDTLSNIFKPPLYLEDCVGIDSVDKRWANKRHSNFAMVNTKFRDLADTGIVRCPTMIYTCRPMPIEIAYEDAIKFCVFNRAMVQVESLNTKIVDWFETRGYIDWMISKIGMPKNSLQKGDAPSGKSALMDEIIGLMNAATNIPIDPTQPSPLELHWIYELLDDLSKFNRDDTHANDLSMAYGESLLGCAKLLFKKIRTGAPKLGEALKFQLS